MSFLEELSKFFKLPHSLQRTDINHVPEGLRSTSNDVCWGISTDGVIGEGYHPLMREPMTLNNAHKLREYIKDKWVKEKLICIGGESGVASTLIYIDFKKLVELLKVELANEEDKQ